MIPCGGWSEHEESARVPSGSAVRALGWLLLAVLLASCAAGGSPSAVGSAASTVAATDQVAVELQALQWAERRQAAAREVLRAQADAVVRRDPAGYLRSVAATEQPTAGLRVRRMLEIGLADLTLVSVAEIAPPVPTAVDTEVAWDVEATYDYRVAGSDRGPRRFVLAVTLRSTPSKPERLTITASRTVDRPQPWDIDGMQVRRSPLALVVGAAGGADLDEVLGRANRAATAVAQVWGRVAPVVWVVPTDSAEAERLLGRMPGELSAVAAATDGPLEVGAPARADRIVLNPGAWTALTAPGRDVVMRHELTHAAVRASTTSPVPLWLSEGFAEYVAYRELDVTDRAVAASLITRLRREGVPEHLPGPERFDPGAGSLSAAYAESWLAVRTLVLALGEEEVVWLYRAAASSDSSGPAHDPEAALDESLTRFGVTRSQLERLWRAQLERLRDR